MQKMFARFMKEEDGATAIEYGLIAAILSVAIIAAVRAVGNELNETYNAIENGLNAAQP